MTDLPTKRSPTYEKVYLAALFDEKPIGGIDFHKDHPGPGQTYIGLLLLNEKYHGSGLGRVVYQAAEKYATNNLSAHMLILGVSERNDVTGFREKMGFSLLSTINLLSCEG